MNKAELIEALADKTGLRRKDAKDVLDAYISIITDRMCNREEVNLVGFGSFVPKLQTERLARNPKSGEPILIPERTTVKFKAGKILLDTVNGQLK